MKSTKVLFSYPGGSGSIEVVTHVGINNNNDIEAVEKMLTTQLEKPVTVDYIGQTVECDQSQIEFRNPYYTGD